MRRCVHFRVLFGAIGTKMSQIFCPLNHAHAASREPIEPTISHGQKTLSIFEQMAPNETHFVHAPVRALPCLVWGHWHKNGPDFLPIGGNEHYWLASRDLCGSQYLQTEVPWQATVPYFATPPYGKSNCRGEPLHNFFSTLNSQPYSSS